MIGREVAARVDLCGAGAVDVADLLMGAGDEDAGCAVLLFVMFTRLAPDESAETEPANSRVAPLATVAVTPVPTDAAPDVALNRSVPVSPTAIELPLPSDGGPSTSSAPLPAFAKAAAGALAKVHRGHCRSIRPRT